MIKVRFAEFLVFLQVSLFTPHLLFFRSNLTSFHYNFPLPPPRRAFSFSEQQKYTHPFSYLQVILISIFI